MRALAIALLLAPGAALAQEVDCETAEVQMELNFCAEQGWQDADQALNGVWPRAKARAQGIDADLPANMQGVWQALLDGQRAWVTYRDKTCEAEGGLFRGGTAESMIVYGCMERLTWERVEELQGFVDSVQ